MNFQLKAHIDMFSEINYHEHTSSKVQASMHQKRIINNTVMSYCTTASTATVPLLLYQMLLCQLLLYPLLLRRLLPSILELCGTVELFGTMLWLGWLLVS